MKTKTVASSIVAAIVSCACLFMFVPTATAAEEKLETGGLVTFNPKGTSMLPMLRDGDDTVVLSKPKGRLHLFDLPLYRRKDGSYVLHRVVNFGSDGSYTMCR